MHWLCGRAEGTDVLDVGCSQGIASILLAREGHVVTGVDNEDSALSFARSELEAEEPHVADRVTFLFAEASRLPFADETFDTVLLGEVLEHQVDPAPLIREAGRVLRPSGTLVITAPYGIFRYPDHKEPLYLGSLIPTLRLGFAPERVELIDRWFGVVARATAVGRRRAVPEEVWAAALGAAEQKLSEVEGTLEKRQEALKDTQARLSQTREELVEVRAAADLLRRSEEEAGARVRDAEERERSVREEQQRAQQAAEQHSTEAEARVREAEERAREAAERERSAREEQQRAQEAAEEHSAEAEARVREAEARVREADEREREAEDRERSAREEQQRALEAAQEQSTAADARVREAQERERSAREEQQRALDAAEQHSAEAARWAAEAEEHRQRVNDVEGQLELALGRLERLRSESEAGEQAVADADRRIATLGRELAIAQVQLEHPHGAALEDGPRASTAPAPTRQEATSTGGNGSPTTTDPEPAETDAAEIAASARERLREHDGEGAARLYQRAAELQPQEAEYWHGLSRARLRLRQFDQARSAAERALEERPGWTPAVMNALEACARSERPEQFAELASELGPLEECSSATVGRLGSLALRAGANSVALEAGRRLLAEDSMNPAGLRTVACAEWELGNEERASSVVQTALATGDQRAVHAALSFARHIDRLDDVPDLLSRLDPPDSKALLDFARRFVKRGEARRALGVLDHAQGAGLRDERVESLRAEAAADLRLYEGDWAPSHSPRRIEPKLGHPLHMVSRSLPHHTSGGTYRTHYILKAQLADGLTPAAVTEVGFPWASGVADAAGLDNLDGIPYYRLSDGGPPGSPLADRMAHGLDRLVDLVEQLRPAVLHPASDYVNAMLALELREIFGLPVVYEVRGFPEERLVRRPGSRVMTDLSVGRRTLELECMQAADRVVTLGEVMKRHMVARGVPAEKIHIVPNAVDPAALRPAPRDETLARRLGLEADEVVLGYVSTFHGYEGIRYIVEATAELIRRGHRARALLVGDGNERARLESLANELGVADAVVFAGRVPHQDVLSYYSLIDLFVVPRRAEATSELVTPLKPFEAMAVGCPLIVSDVGALREVANDGRTGRTFRPEDPIDLADVAEGLIEDAGARGELAAAAREWVTTERTWAKNAQVYRALYEELGVA